MTDTRPFEAIKVSAVLSTFNRFPSLIAAIESIRGQTHRNIEIIVVNDGSTDARYYQARPQDVLWIDLPYSSRELYGYPCLAHVRNAGLAQASGEYVAFLDDDDLWMPDKIGKQLRALAQSGAALAATEGFLGHPAEGCQRPPLYHAEHFRDYCRSFARQHPDLGLDDGELPARFTLPLICRHNFVIHSSMTVRRSLLNKIRGYRLFPLYGITVNDELHVEDWDLWKRCLEHSDCVYLHEPLVHVRPEQSVDARASVYQRMIATARRQAGLKRVVARARQWMRSAPTGHPLDVRRYRDAALKIIHRLRDGMRLAAPTGKMPLLIDGKPCLFVAALDGNPLPEGLRHQNAFQVVALTAQTLGDYLEDVHPAFECLSPRHQSDYLRSQVLHRYGGLYFDPQQDMGNMALWRLYEKLHGCDLVLYNKHPTGQLFGIGNLGPMRRDSNFTAAWSARVAALMDCRHDALRAYRQRLPDSEIDGLEPAELLNALAPDLAHHLDRTNRLSFRLP